jgi:hypothetical protein
VKTATQQLPRILIAGRGENWMDYGHHESGTVYAWDRDEGFDTLPGVGFHSELERGGVIIGRIDGQVASMGTNPDFDEALDLPEFLLDMAAVFPDVKQIRRFIEY